MEKLRNFVVATFAATILSAVLNYLTLEANFLIFGFMPLIILAFISESQGNKESWSGVLSIALIYSVMYSQWPITSLVIVLILIAYSFLRTPQANLSLLAAWLLGVELSTAITEFYYDHTYYTEYLWHDISTLAFVVYALYWDIKEATH